MPKMTGAEILIESLKREGVEQIFGYPGGAVIPIFDQLYQTRPFQFLLMRHEQAAAHAADGYARATGKVGVCLVTSGPGATNTITGIATANMDSIPMVVIAGQVRTQLIGNDAFQEVALCNMTDPIVKHNFLVESVEELSRNIKEAFYVASTGRPGTVVVDLPVDITQAECAFDLNPEIELAGYQPKVKICQQKLHQVLKTIRKAKKPLFYAGGGIILANASKEFTMLARKLKVPVTTTLMGLGCFPEDDPLSLGMLGMHGTKYANMAVQNCDCLVAIGARFDDRVTGNIEKFAPGTHRKNGTIIHIDIDPSSISKNVVVDIDLVGDAKQVIKQLLEHPTKLRTNPWRRQIDKWKKRYPLNYNQRTDDLKPQYILQCLSQLTKGRAVIVTDVGQHQMWTAQWIEHLRPRTFLSSGGLGTMGYGLPAAIGAQVGKPHSTVVLITGDGSIQMNIQELATLVAFKLPVKILVMNNGYLGMVRQWQELFFGKRYSQTDLATINPDFPSVAKAFGLNAAVLEKKSEVISTLKAALAYQGPYLLDCRIAREENVFPMVPAGRSLDEMIGITA